MVARAAADRDGSHSMAEAVPQIGRTGRHAIQLVSPNQLHLRPTTRSESQVAQGQGGQGQVSKIHSQLPYKRLAQLTLARLKSHFTSLLSTISFTLYALLPTLQPQLLDRYPVEETSQALQGMSMTSSTASIQPEQPVSVESPENSLHLNKGESEAGTSVSGDEPVSAVGESWASEFRRRDGEHQAVSGERDEVVSMVQALRID